MTCLLSLHKWFNWFKLYHWWQQEEGPAAALVVHVRGPAEVHAVGVGIPEQIVEVQLLGLQNVTISAFARKGGFLTTVDLLLQLNVGQG